ncbi:MAG: putative lipid II flippase FtsW [Coriobacteriia bacterium]
MTSRSKYAGGPTARYLLLFSAMALVSLGLIMVYSASSVADYVNLNDSAYHFKRQLGWMALGLVGMAFAMRLDYRGVRRFAWPFFALCVGALVLVPLVGMGKWGAQRWISIGGVSIQPSEYAKLACLLVAAHLIVQLRSRTIGPKDFWGRLALACGTATILIMAQPDMGTTISLLAAVFVVLILGNIRALWLVSITVSGAVLGLAAIFSAGYRAQRFMAFLDPWADPQKGGYQTIQAMLAFGSGGVDGVGLGLSRQKFFYLPAAHTDFIFAIIGEELGLIGTLSVVLVFVVFAYAGIRIALGARDEFGKLLAGGLTGMIATQAIMNMMAVTGLMPVTGIPLPFVSSGGSSLTFTLVCVGLVLSVSSHGTRGVRPVPVADAGKENARARDDERGRNRRPHLSGISGGRGTSRRRA